MSVSSRDSSGSPSRRRRPRLPSWVLNADDPFKSDPLSIIRPHATRRLSTSDDISGFFGNRRTRARSFSNQRPQTAGGASNSTGHFPLTNRPNNNFHPNRLEAIPSVGSTTGDSRGRTIERSQPSSTSIVLVAGKRRSIQKFVTLGIYQGDGKRLRRKKSFIGLENHPIPSTPFDPFGETDEAPFPDMRQLDRKESTKNKGLGRLEAKRKRPIPFLGRFKPFSRTNLAGINEANYLSSPRNIDKALASALVPQHEAQRLRSVDGLPAEQSQVFTVMRTRSGNAGDKHSKSEKRTSMMDRIRHAVKKGDKSL